MAIPTLDELMNIAKDRGASDIHLTVGVPPKLRVNGHLETLDYDRLMGDDTQRYADEIMQDEKQRRKFVDTGEIDMSFGRANLGRYRLNAFRQRGSVALALRVVSTDVPDPVTLGVPDSVIDLYDRKRGLVLVTGPTGSGKSTTLAAIIDKINNNRDAHVITLEDPIEYTHRHKKSIVNQREIGLDSGSYQSALRAALREDPDVILVGEMRDFDTISIAITAAETGHLVLSTLHTIGAASTVDRVIDVFPSDQQQQVRIQFANVLEAVISQQLIPTIDGTGRVAAFEVLHANHAVRNLIREGKSHQLMSVMQTNRKSGMMVMDEAIQQLYTAGKISRDMAIQFAVDPDAMAAKLS
ncbi:MAG: type IV pilus twitching motility protein PilT [Lachnospiraceae bacterium]|nr:type IV pilus twitching motility protein PilT [Lachnospiraceae bacterium]